MRLRDYLNHHQLKREAKHTQGSSESAMLSQRNEKHINTRGLSQMSCPKSTVNRCSPGDMEVREALVSQAEEGGGKGPAKGFSLD